MEERATPLYTELPGDHPYGHPHGSFGAFTSDSDYSTTRTPSGYTNSIQESPVLSRGLYSPRETAPSVATTPLSGYSAGISRSNKQLVQHQTLPTATPLVATKQGVFRPYSPAKARKCEEGLSKACLDCHFKKRTCSPKGATSTCDSCLGKSTYCKGTISIAGFVDTAQWLQQAKESLPNQCAPLKGVSSPSSNVALAVRLNKELPTQGSSNTQVGTEDAKLYDLDVGGTSLTRSQESKENLDGILDMILLSLQCPILSGTDAKYQCLAPLKTCCRRLIAALSLLSKTSASSLDTRLWDDCVAPYVVLSFMAHVSEGITALLCDLSIYLNQFVRASRSRQQFADQAWTVAFNLGLIYTALDSLKVGRQARKRSGQIFANLFSSTDTVLAQIKSIGLGIREKGFQSGIEFEQVRLPGIVLAVRDTGHADVDRRSRLNRLQEQSFDAFDYVLAQCSQWPHMAAKIRPAPRATFHLGAESPTPDSMHDDDALDSRADSPIMNEGCTRDSTEDRSTLQAKTRRNLLDMKLEANELHGQINHKEKMLAELTMEVTAHQTRLEELEDRIRLAEFLCQLPLPSGARTHSNISDLEPLQPDITAAGQRDIHPATVESWSLAHDPSNLTFSPSDRTLVELGQQAADGGDITAPTPGEDVEMLAPMNTVPTSTGCPGGHELQSQMISEVCEVESLHSPPQILPISTHHEGQTRKRRRLTGFFSAKVPDKEYSRPAISREPTSVVQPNTQVEPVQQSRKPALFHGRSRRSRIMMDQLSAFQARLEGFGKSGTDASKADTERPVSYPQSQRWRMSLGVSVKSLTEGFEKMRLRQKQTRIAKEAST